MGFIEFTTRTIYDRLIGWWVAFSFSVIIGYAKCCMDFAYISDQDAKRECVWLLFYWIVTVMLNGTSWLFSLHIGSLSFLRSNYVLDADRAVVLYFLNMDYWAQKVS